MWKWKHCRVVVVVRVRDGEDMFCAGKMAVLICIYTCVCELQILGNWFVKFEVAGCWSQDSW